MGELLLLVLVIGLVLWWGVRGARGARRHVGGGSVQCGTTAAVYQRDCHS